MLTILIHRIGIAASVEKIYRAITTDEGIKGWWTTDVKMDAPKPQRVHSGASPAHGHKLTA